MPQNLESFSEDMDVIAERDSSIFWKVRGMASKITYRLFSKYGNPKYSKGQEDFCQSFLDKFAEPLLESHL